MKNRIWISWETQRRNKELASAFNCKLLELDYSASSPLVRYLRCSALTLTALIGKNQTFVCTQCPSVILTTVISCLRLVKKFTFVIDAHNAALEYAAHRNALLRQLARFSLSKADFVIVSNQALAASIEALGSVPVVLPDKLSEIGKASIPKQFSRLKKPLITLVCSFAADEPTEMFLEGMKHVKEPFTLLITGSKTKAGALMAYENKDIIFTDFLSKADYEALVQNSCLLAVLTTRENCLVCGAYEGTAAEVPLLLSDTEVLRKTFGQGSFFALNTAEGYRKAVEEFFAAESSKLKSDCMERKTDFLQSWSQNFQAAAKRMAL